MATKAADISNTEQQNANLARIADEGIVEIRGKRYKTVARRVAEFRNKFSLESGWRINTTLLHRDDSGVVIRAEILDPSDRVIATGHAEEKREGSINLTSALENCETSAIGRALAASGMAGAEYGSADELAHALEARERFVEQRKERLDSYLADILEKLEADDQWGAMELWRELERDEQTGMWRSFNTHQKKWMRDAEQFVIRDKGEKKEPMPRRPVDENRKGKQ